MLTRLKYNTEMLNLVIKLHIFSDKCLWHEIKAPMQDCAMRTHSQLDTPIVIC